MAAITSSLVDARFALVTSATSKSAGLLAHYDAMWRDAAPVVRAGGAEIDPTLECPTADPRRGFTLLARPAASVSAALVSLSEKLRALEPAQYYQPASGLHHTILSLFTATVDYAPYLAHVDAYSAAVTEAATGIGPFEIEVWGVTLVRGAVLAQGFAKGEALGELRDRLRAALAARGLGEGLDQRYRLVTAHMTIARFAAPINDASRFVDMIEAERATDFGTSLIDRLDLVFGDWYHTAQNERQIARCLLTAQTSAA